MNDPAGRAPAPSTAPVLEQVTVRFAGDSGDGMQVVGTLFTEDSAHRGHDIATLPDFPAEIRAPAGTRAGVSAYQLQFGGEGVHTPGDHPDVLVAFNPAALVVNLPALEPGAVVILNTDAFDAKHLKTAGLHQDPREDGSLEGLRVIEVPMTRLTTEAVAPVGLGRRQAQQCKNMLALGIIAWMYDRPLEEFRERIRRRLGGRGEQVLEANLKALQAGYDFAENAELVTSPWSVRTSELPPGTYRRVTGTQAMALGLVAAADRAGLPLLYASYPITPASEMLHELARLAHTGLRTFQAEDEIAAAGAALGAAWGGAIGVTASSGPGLSLKSEMLGLAVMTELPMVLIDVQRGGPSTGLPTKTEQADLLQALFGRHGESPLPVLAPTTPADCFAVAMEAVRIAISYMTPVVVLSDGYLANGSEPWRVPSVDELPAIPVRFAAPGEPGFAPYRRDPETLARPWAVPGTPGLEHRIGGLEKSEPDGNVSYDPANHEHMVRQRQAKVDGIAADIPPLVTHGPREGDLLILGWGSTGGAIRAATERLQRRGHSVAWAQLRYLNPLPRNLGEVLHHYQQVLIPELNLGQLRGLVRARYLVSAVGLNKVQGQPLKVSEVERVAHALLHGEAQAALEA